MSGFFHWIRRRVHGTNIYESNEEQPFDEDTAGLIEGSIVLVERMRSGGINLSKPRTVTHLFLGLDRNIGRAAKLLSQQGYSIEEQGGGRLLLSEYIAVSESWVRRVVPAMCQTAGEFELAYDGWDADVAGEYAGQDN
jgi:hypothetical protein